MYEWEYKGKHKDPRVAYQQLLKYRESLINPPLLIVCDLNKSEIHPNFPGYAPKKYEFDLNGLKDARNVQLLRYAFTDPDKLKPDQTQESVTKESPTRSRNSPTACGHATKSRNRGALLNEAYVLHVRGGHRDSAARTVHGHGEVREEQSGTT